MDMKNDGGGTKVERASERELVDGLSQRLMRL